MRKLYSSFRNVRRLNTEGGFTLIELLVVIAIIAILAAIAVPQYTKYREKATVSSYALPIARACVLDVATACLETGSVSANPVNASSYPNCATPQSTSAGSVSLYKVTDFSCNATTGKLTAGKIEAQLGSTYEVDCEAGTSGDVKCTVVGYTSGAD